MDKDQIIKDLQQRLDKAERCIKLAHDNRDNLYEVSHILHTYFNEFLEATALNTSQVESKEAK